MLRPCSVGFLTASLAKLLEADQSARKRSSDIHGRHLAGLAPSSFLPTHDDDGIGHAHAGGRHEVARRRRPHQSRICWAMCLKHYGNQSEEIWPNFPKK